MKAFSLSPLSLSLSLSLSLCGGWVSTRYLKGSTCIFVWSPSWISLTLSRHLFLSSIALGKSSRLHPVSAQSCCIEILVGRSTFACPCEGIHRSMSLMSSSLLHHQCPACLVRLTWIVFVMGGRWPYSCYFVGSCLQDLFNIVRSILV